MNDTPHAPRVSQPQTVGTPPHGPARHRAEGGGLLAHVVSTFSSRQWENIATESLRFLLAGNASAAPGNLLRPFLEVPGQLYWRGQSDSGDGTGIPDLVGHDTEHRPVVMIEGKFWAALTPQQPLGYLRRQAIAFPTTPPDPEHTEHTEPTEPPAGTETARAGDAAAAPSPRTHALLFLVPSQRQELVAGEVGDRMGCRVKLDGATGMHVLDNGQLVVVVSWAAMLREVETCLRRAEDLAGLADLAQLAGLCDRADREAMLPFTPADLDTTIPRRLMDFYNLVDLVVRALKAAKVSSSKGLKTSSRRGRYGTFQRHLATGSEFMVCLSTYAWATYHHTPLYLRVRRANEDTLQAWRALVASGDLAGLGGPDGSGHHYVALRVPTGVEQHQVVASLTNQATVALAAMRPGPGGRSAAEPDPEADSPGDPDSDPDGDRPGRSGGNVDEDSADRLVPAVGRERSRSGAASGGGLQAAI